MTRTKLKRLSKVKELPNVFSLETAERQNTIQEYFKSKNIFTLEIGCGHGDYSVELAQRYPQRNFVGLDIKGARVFQGAMKAIDQKLDNVAFIIGKAEKLNEIFPPKSIEEIYIAFPDPHVRRTNQKRRLISPNFLKIYKDLLIASGIILFKTDNQSLYEYALRIISDFGCDILYSTEHLYKEDDSKDHSSIITIYEKHYIKEGRKIKYICFRF
jgi:tRNA (guanine-N7-)-methyltransferase